MNIMGAMHASADMSCLSLRHHLNFFFHHPVFQNPKLSRALTNFTTLNPRGPIPVTRQRVLRSVPPWGRVDNSGG